MTAHVIRDNCYYNDVIYTSQVLQDKVLEIFGFALIDSSELMH